VEIREKFRLVRACPGKFPPRNLDAKNRRPGTAETSLRSQGEPAVAIMEDDMSATGLDVFANNPHLA
jgi:hypothetical protein